MCTYINEYMCYCHKPLSSHNTIARAFLLCLCINRCICITFSDIIRICGHVVDDVITLWWSRGSWYNFSPSWMKFSSWWDFVYLGVILHLGQINRILVRFFFALDTIFVLVRFFFFFFLSFHILVQSTASWYDFSRLFRLSVILFDLVSLYILMRLTASWCDLCVLGIDIFCTLVFYSCM